MADNIRTNFRKVTRSARLNTNLDGRSGVTNFAGHAASHGIGIHVHLDSEPDRAVVVLLMHDADINAVRELIAEHDRLRKS